MNDQILAKIRLWQQESKLPCAVAHYIAAELAVSPRKVGEVADQENGARITQCQLGLFGYAKKGTPTYKILKPMDPIPEALKQAIDVASHDGHISCARLWQIADQFDISRHEVGNAADSLGLKVKPCQLGCF
jgi:hypothetical protein